MGHLLGVEWVLLPFISLYVLSPFLDVLAITYFPQINDLNFFKKVNTKVVDNAIKAYPFIQLLIFALIMIKFKNTEVNKEFILNALSFGVVCGGTGLMIAHELMHRKDRVSKVGAIILTGMAGYSHWIIEHILGHHKNVATPIDPCTARKNESLYAFFARSIIGQYRSAFNLNTKKFLKLKAVEILFYMTVFYFFSLPGLLFVLIQSVVAIILLEHVNYVEHYGLVREKSANGKFKKVTDGHSWDSYSILTNIALLNLGFHADHHAHVNKEFTELEAKSKNVITYGIPAQLLLSAIPSVWFSIMNPKLENKSYDLPGNSGEILA